MVFVKPRPEGFDSQLRFLFKEALETSQLLPEDKRIIAYDASDARSDAVTDADIKFMKRFDPRRAKKTSAAPAAATAPPTVVVPEFNPAAFNFSKINPTEVLWELSLGNQTYKLITQKFPVASNHMLLTTSELRPQVLTRADLVALKEFQKVSEFNVIFNSWSAGSSVNHFHVHLTDEALPVLSATLREVSVPGHTVYYSESYPAMHIVFRSSDVELLWRFIDSMQKNNQPHNLVFGNGYVYVFPRHTSPERRGKDIYGEICGGFEMSGWFTLYGEREYLSFESLMMATCLLSVTKVPDDRLFGELVVAAFRDGCLIAQPPRRMSIRHSISGEFSMDGHDGEDLFIANLTCRA